MNPKVKGMLKEEGLLILLQSMRKTT